VFDSGDLRVVMKEGSTWTFNPECCTLLSAEAAAAAASDAVESSSDDDDDEESIQITRMLTFVAVHTCFFDLLYIKVLLTSSNLRN